MEKCINSRCNKFDFAASIRDRIRCGKEPHPEDPMMLLALKRPAFKVARKGEECMYEIYTTRLHLDPYRGRVMPSRAVDSARSQRRKTRYDLVPASGSPHGARFSLVITKLPLWKIRSARPHGRFSLFSFPSSASLPIVVLLSRDRPTAAAAAVTAAASSSSSAPPPIPRTPFSLGVIAKSATHYPILPPWSAFSLLLSFSLLPHRMPLPPTLLAFLFQIASSSSRSPRREIDPVSLRLPR